MAARVWSGSGALAVIVTLQGPTARFGRDAVGAALVPVLERTRAISESMGFEPSAPGR